jgi:hypothetical protein
MFFAGWADCASCSLAVGRATHVEQVSDKLLDRYPGHPAWDLGCGAQNATPQTDVENTETLWAGWNQFKIKPVGRHFFFFSGVNQAVIPEQDKVVLSIASTPVWPRSGWNLLSRWDKLSVFFTMNNFLLEQTRVCLVRPQSLWTSVFGIEAFRSHPF